MVKWFAAAAVVCAVCTATRPGGRYGHWTESVAGNPVFRYQLDQLADKPDASGGWAGVPPSSDPAIRGSREHTFQIGNDRLVLVANNYGAVRVRSDEGSPKWWTAAQTGDMPGATAFGAGFGYLSRNQVVEATTYYTGGQSDRDFGIGWVTTSGTSSTAVVNHTVATPQGDDPVVLVEVVVHNTGDQAASWDWVEVWGSSMAYRYT